MNTMDTSAITEVLALADLHCDCFACGVCNGAGLKLNFDVGTDGTASAVWQPSAAFRSYPDRVHGGVVATLLDSAIVHALSARGVAGVTAELTVRFLQSVNVHDPVRVAGWVESERIGVYLCRGEVRQAGVVAVRASGKFMATEWKRIKRTPNHEFPIRLLRS